MPSIISSTSSCSLVSLITRSPTLAPLRRTVARSATRKISSMRWETKTMAMPLRFQSPIRSNRRLTCRLSRLAVASSRIIRRGRRLSALRISTTCRSSGGRLLTGASGSSED